MKKESRLTDLKARLNWDTRGPKEAEGGYTRKEARGETREAEGDKNPSNPGDFSLLNF